MTSLCRGTGCTRCGDRAGQWSIRVSANWRIVFRFDGVEAVDVELTDYH